jgi:hypothetical protein
MSSPGAVLLLLGVPKPHLLLLLLPLLLLLLLCGRKGPWPCPLLLWQRWLLLLLLSGVDLLLVLLPICPWSWPCPWQPSSLPVLLERMAARPLLLLPWLTVP